MPEPRRFRTKYGLQTGQQWIESKFKEENAKWLTPSALHYIFCRIPYHDANKQEIVDEIWKYLCAENPDAAREQLQFECRSFFDQLPARRQKLAEQRLQESKAMAQYVAKRKKAKPNKSSATQPSTDPLHQFGFL